MKPLKPIKLGESVRVRLPGEKVWSPAECVGFAGPRSYLVKTGDAVYHRNRHDLLSTGEPLLLISLICLLPLSPVAVMQNPLEEICLRLMYLSQVCHLFLSQCMPTSVEQGRQETPSPVPSSVLPTNLRRSQRERRPPKRFQDFVLNQQKDFKTCSKLTLKSEFCSVLVYKLGIN